MSSRGRLHHRSSERSPRRRRHHDHHHYDHPRHKKSYDRDFDSNIYKEDRNHRHKRRDRHHRRDLEYREDDKSKRRRSVLPSRENGRVLRSPGPPPNLLKPQKLKERISSQKRRSVSKSRYPKIRIAPSLRTSTREKRKRSRSKSPKSKLHHSDSKRIKTKSIEDDKQVDLRIVIEESLKASRFKHNRTDRDKRRSSSITRKSQRRSPDRRSSIKIKDDDRSRRNRRVSTSSVGHHSHDRNDISKLSEDTELKTSHGRRSRDVESLIKSRSDSKDIKCNYTERRNETASPVSALTIVVTEKDPPKDEPSLESITKGSLTSPPSNTKPERRRSLSYSSISSESISSYCSTCSSSSSSCTTCSSSSSSSGTTCSTCSSGSSTSNNTQNVPSESFPLQNLTILAQQIEKDEADSAVAAVTKPKTSSNADKAAALAALVCEEMKLSGKVDAVRKALNNEVKNLTDFKEMLQLVSEKTDEFLGNITTYDPNRKKPLRQDLVRFLKSSGAMNSDAVNNITSKVIPKDVLKSPILSLVQDILAKKSVDLLVLKAANKLASSPNK